ncbi:transposase family protein [Synechocystis sp. PCC 7509]|uniref:transposase family protein n=1 Tax=Synechocystis sp. PCC 7509 TaxID=927677 RepID=UPI001D0D7362
MKCLADKGYQGIQKYHLFSQIPKKKPSKSKLSPLDKKANRELAIERVLIENVFTQLKKFRILQGRYRNRRKRFELRFNLIAYLYNYELTLGLNPILT